MIIDTLFYHFITFPFSRKLQGIAGSFEKGKGLRA